MERNRLDFLWRHILSDDFSLDARLVNVTCIVGMSAVFTTMIIRLILRASPGIIIALAVFQVIILGIMYFANRLNAYGVCKVIALVLFCFIILPSAFFFFGGIDSSVNCYFVMAMVFIFLLMRGRLLAVFVTVQLVIVFACYYIQFLYPEIIFKLGGGEEYLRKIHFIDRLQGYIIVGFTLGIIVSLQSRFYRSEKNKSGTAARGLEMAQRTIKAMFDSNPHINILFDSHLRIIDCNPATLRYLGFESKDDLISGFVDQVSRAIPEYQSNGSKSIPLVDRLKTAVTEGAVHFETDLCLLDSMRVLDVEFKRIPYGDNFAIVGYLVDLTAVRETENKIMLAMEQAQAANRAKSEFLSNMSHEIRTPMNAIIGMTSIGKGSPDMDRKDYAFGKIEDASSHLLGIINDILDMSKIEAGKFELSFVEFNFEKMLKKVSDVIAFRMDEKKQQFFVRIDRNIPGSVIGDDQRLAQVITNLLSNAVKFTPEGGRITLDALFVEEKDAIVTLRVEVRDTGIGISPEQQSRLFTTFQQAEGGTTRKFGGTGLGLAISKRIVEMMDGQIWIESELGKGAAFIFTVKLEKTHSGLEDIKKKEAEAVIVEGEFDGRHILLVEDIEINREIVLTLLEPTKLAIDCAVDGRAAFDKFCANPDAYEMIFMDIQMPQMDGYEATRHIREFEKESSERTKTKLKRVPIIAMTANVFREDVEKCLAAGMDDHIGKPLAIAEAIEKLRKYLQ